MFPCGTDCMKQSIRCSTYYWLPLRYLLHMRMPNRMHRWVNWGGCLYLMGTMFLGVRTGLMKVENCMNARKASSVLHTSGCARLYCSMRYEDGQLMHRWVCCTGGFAYDGRIVPWGTGLMDVNKCMAAKRPAFYISSDRHVGIATWNMRMAT